MDGRSLLSGLDRASINLGSLPETATRRQTYEPYIVRVAGVREAPNRRTDGVTANHLPFRVMLHPSFIYGIHFRGLFAMLQRLPNILDTTGADLAVLIALPSSWSHLDATISTCPIA